MREVSSVPEELLLQVFNLIQAAKENTNLVPRLFNSLPIPSLLQGIIWVSDYFIELEEYDKL
jgi:hypothetical protein